MEKITFRSFKEGDYETCCDWWDWWWKGEIPVKKELLPHDSTCFIIEKEAKDTYGMVELFTVCGNRFMQQIHRKLNWCMHPAAYEAFKYL